MSNKTKDNPIKLFNAENGSVLSKSHGIEVSLPIRSIEIGIRVERVSARMLNHRWQFWFDNHHRREVSGVPTVGYYHGARLFFRHKNLEIYFPTVLFSHPTIGVPGFVATARTRLYGVVLRMKYTGPYRVPYEAVRYVSVFDFEASYGEGIEIFARAGRVNVPLAIETRMQRMRFALGIRLSTQ